jgi:hypothetical protein
MIVMNPVTTSARETRLRSHSMTDHHANSLSRLPRSAYLMSAGPIGSGIFNRPPLQPPAASRSDRLEQ